LSVSLNIQCNLDNYMVRSLVSSLHSLQYLYRHSSLKNASSSHHDALIVALRQRPFSEATEASTSSSWVPQWLKNKLPGAGVCASLLLALCNPSGDATFSSRTLVSVLQDLLAAYRSMMNLRSLIWTVCFWHSLGHDPIS